jgi:peptidoglycan/xylan/chitin deacetylase (PgdA/CDA1 family)
MHYLGPEGDSGTAPKAFTDWNSVRNYWQKGLLILMYHAIEKPNPNYDYQFLYVAPEKLREQVRELKEAGVQFIRASEVNGAGGHGRQALITLDDGFKNVFDHALPVFREFGVPAITYIVAGQIGGSNAWDHHLNLQKRPLMSRSEILEWLEAGLEIGAHTVNHPNLSRIPPAEARREIFDSKKILEDLTGRAIVHFCYPHGGWTPQVRDFVEEAGFETATTCDVGCNFPDKDNLALRRLVAI